MTELIEVLGIDIGSVAISIVEMDKNRQILRTHYKFHQGNIPHTLQSMLRKLDIKSINAIACTTSAAGFLKGSHVYDSRVASIRESECCSSSLTSLRSVISRVLMTIPATAGSLRRFFPVDSISRHDPCLCI